LCHTLCGRRCWKGKPFMNEWDMVSFCCCERGGACTWGPDDGVGRT
jgi:hypothetical protein